jgi:MYXO-CTERM domain-containing protein
MSRLVVAVLAVLGILAVVVGIIYLVEPIHSLPSFFPGSAATGRVTITSADTSPSQWALSLLIIAAVAGRSRRAH